MSTLAVYNSQYVLSPYILHEQVESSLRAPFYSIHFPLSVLRHPLMRIDKNPASLLTSRELLPSLRTLSFIPNIWLFLTPVGHHSGKEFLNRPLGISISLTVKLLEQCFPM